MEYRSSKDMSLIWNITSRRINVLAKQGRIKGAKLIGNTWMIPYDSCKPSDNRFKNNKENLSYLHFPILMCQPYNNSNFVASLTNDEKKLLNAEKIFSANRMDESIDKFISLLKSKYPYIRIGALYHLSFTYLLNQEFDNYEKYYKLMENEIDSYYKEREELYLLKEKLSLLVKGNVGLTFNNENLSNIQYKRGSYTFITDYMFYSNVINLLKGTGNKNITIYEFVASSFIKNDSPYIANQLYTYIALMYRVLNDNINLEKNLRIAIEIAYKYKIYNLLCEIKHFVNKIFDKILLDYPNSLKEIFEKGNKLYLDSINAIAIHYNGNNIPILKDTDYRYILYAISNTPNKVIAIDRNISEAAVSKKYQSLYELFNVNSKEELASKFISSIANPYLIIN